MADAPDNRPRPITKVVVGYKTRLRDGAEKLTPEFAAPSNYKDAAKIAAYQEERRQAFAADAKDMPYTGTFEEVFLLVPGVRDEKRPEEKSPKALMYTSRPGVEDGKPPPALRVCNFLLKTWPRAWSNDTHARGRPEVVFIGFNPRLFLKMLGIECSMLGEGRAAPLTLWYGNADHRDVGEAVCPKEFPGLTLPFALKCRRPADPADAATWDALTAGWTGPGGDAQRDARIAIELATQLGFLDE